MSADPSAPRPHKRLRHIRSLHVRNFSGLNGSAQPLSESNGVCFVLWSHILPNNTEGEARGLKCVYASEAVYGTSAPEWAPLDLTHLCHEDDQLARVSGEDRAQQQDNAQLSDTDAQSPAQCRGKPAHVNGREGLRVLTHRGDSAESLKALDADDESAGTEKSSEQATRAALACCTAMKLPGKLHLAFSIALDDMQCIAGDFSDLADLDPAYPPNTLLVEMADGIYAEPGLLTADASLPSEPSTARPQQTPKASRRRSAAGTPVHATPPASLPDEPQGALPGVLRALLWRSPAPEGSQRGADESLMSHHTRTASSESALAEAVGTPEPAIRFLQAQGAPPSPHRMATQSQQEASPGFLSPISGLSPQGSWQNVSHAAAPDTQALELASLEAGLQSLVAAQTVLSQRKQHCQTLHHRLHQALHAREAAQKQQDALHAARHQAAHEALQTATKRLGVAERMLQDQGRKERWGKLRAQLTGRRCLLAASLANLFSLGPQAVLEPQPPPEGYVWDLLDDSWSGAPSAPLAERGPITATPSAEPPLPQKSVQDRRMEQLERLATSWFHGGAEAASSSDGASQSAQNSASAMYRETAMLSIGGLYLSPQLYQARGDDDTANPLDNDPEQIRKTASALGYVAHILALLGPYLDVPLRYPLKAAASQSAVLDAAAPAGRSGVMRQHLASDSGRAMVLLSRTQSRITEAELANMTPTPTEFPLYCTDPSQRTRFAYAAYLLNKDVEQLLDAHGLASVGPSALLANLYKLLSAAASGLPTQSQMLY
ncbi:hypothetical protein WJX73_000217 [Symbiochloris irregularis]|uniref:UV radiation resistance-associated gene protein n=1 Tax=Symbiochloris irregularis TaxID=706552 RepID=A0AAW1PM26_9CHLO